MVTSAHSGLVAHCRSSSLVGPPGYTRLWLSVGSTIILGVFTFLEKGVDLTKFRAPECPAGCPDRADLGQQS